MKTVDIPGGTATLREKPDVRVRDKRLVEAAGIAAAPLLARLPADSAGKLALSETQVLGLGISAHDMALLWDINDAAIIAVLASWTLNCPLPTLQTLGDLDPDLYEALSNACAELGAELTEETFEPSAPDSPGFEASPTEPSAASDSDSEGTPTSESHDTSSSTGTSTSTDEPSQG